jgi:hypothetical protein
LWSKGFGDNAAKIKEFKLQMIGEVRIGPEKSRDRPENFSERESSHDLLRVATLSFAYSENLPENA